MLADLPWESVYDILDGQGDHANHSDRKNALMDPLSLAVGGVIFGVGVVTGRTGRRSKAPKPPELVCSCRHGYGMHADGGLCHGCTPRWDVTQGTYDVACTCRLYDGPEPLPRVWTSDPTGLGGGNDGI